MSYKFNTFVDFCFFRIYNSDENKIHANERIENMKIIKNVNLYGEIVDIATKDGIITEIGNLDGDGVDFGGARIFPGLIDIHSHGCIGNDSTVDDRLEAMADWELSQGVTTWYPTTMTMSREDLIEATARDIDFGHGANIPGFHMEGPFVNEKYKGAQNPEFIISPDIEFIKNCKNVKRITLAPEVAGAMEFIKNCPFQISIGHTDADYDTAKLAFENGASSLTHTYNAMPGIHHRNPGPIGAASDSPNAYAELICDGTHVHQSAVKMLIKIMGTDRVILVSDSMNATGLPDGEYMFGGQITYVKDSAARLANGALAGSTSSLFKCVQVAISFGISPEDAVKMASENPARLMGLNKGKIEVGRDADFIIVDEDFNLIKAIARGEF